MDFWEKLMFKLVIQFVLRQLEKFQKTIDWAKVKADADPRIRAIVPGTWFDQDAVDAVNQLIDLAACALSQTSTIDNVLQLIAAQKWTEAYDVLRQLLLDVWTGGACPIPTLAPKAVAALKAA